jgi:SAM-dependent methyltransferase
MDMMCRLQELLSQRGPSGALNHLMRRMAKGIEQYRPQALKFRRALALRDARYDAENHVDTGGLTHLEKLSITSPNRRFGVAHIATDPEEFARGVSQLPIRHEEFVFVDLGSGKGRALLLAREYPFRRIIGVEFARELHQIAETNTRRRGRIELHCMDVVEFDFPLEPLVVFLYNPFGPEVMARVAQRLYASYVASPRLMYVLYINPFYVEPWQALGFRTVRSGGGPFVILMPPQPD